MLRKKAIRKIFITTLTAFILLVVYSIPNMIEEEKTIKTNLEVEYISGLGTNNIYLLDQNDYLVKTNILLDKKDKVEQIKLLLSNLIKHDNSKFPNGLRATIPANTKVIDVIYDEGYVTINFSKRFLNVDSELKDRMMESVVYSIMDLGDIKGVIIEVEEEILKDYNRVLDRSMGINRKYNIKSRNKINKVVVYYLEEIENNKYYVPVTKYLNDDRDKIKIIVDELTTSYIYEPNLMSFFNSNTKLLGHEEKENIMSINFNQAIFDRDHKVVEEVKYTLAYSIFDNYDVNQILLQVDGKNIETIGKKDLP
ncbi:MAG: GerMN domain-containing protein [Bacilli bacterium]|nr:GerMN domain-containing protein [Bacilli bacterium]